MQMSFRIAFVMLIVAIALMAMRGRDEFKPYPSASLPDVNVP
jgi:hypothetical protein